ncbi:MAG: 6-bladed beta-propeller, partial [Nitrososphaerales archaeon]
FIAKWGSKGSGDGEFNFPSGVGIDSSDNVYVVDISNHRIQKFTNDGKFIAKWGSKGSGDGEFNFPKGIAIDPSGKIYVTDASNHRVQVFTVSVSTSAPTAMTDEPKE